mmetsp:Transcript_6664/g.15113  ORF Transcript_6664/g.15113 Transcript_6664/m.15113 type:complete len:805 (+) Transcript_6664:156-2570(+)
MPSLETVNRSTFTFRSDITTLGRDTHKSGTLHATKNADGREEHAFAWLDDKSHVNVENVTSHLAQFGFRDSRILFIPYSSLENWMHRYPHACPYMQCDDKGVIKGMPHFQQCINNDPSQAAAIESTAKASSSSRPTKKQKRSSTKNIPKIMPTANLTDAERSQLHIEIYTYFSWLHTELIELETTEPGRRRVRGAGISVPGMQNLMSKLESTFRNVGEYKTKEAADNMAEGEGREVANNNGENNTNDNNGRETTTNNDSEKENAAPTQLPLLEKSSFKEDLRRVIEEAQGENNNSNNNAQEQAAGSNKTNGNPRDFEAMYERLLAYKEQNGHVIVPLRYREGDICLGRWVGDMRRHKKKLLADGLESEDGVMSLPVSAGHLGLSFRFLIPGTIGATITAIDPACTFKDRIKVGDQLVSIDGVDVKTVEDFELGKDKEERIFGIVKKKSYPYNLSSERVERLDSIGFRWVMGNDVKSWDERLALLKQFREIHGKWPSKNEKWEGIGNWVHNQRRYYVQKDKKFMANRAPKLDEIGFPWVLRKSNITLSWEDQFQKLVEFSRVNRHFNVPCPEEAPGDKEENETETTEALRFYRWVQQLHYNYRHYQYGGQTSLNENRVNQLLELGFEFKEGTAPSTPKNAVVPDIPFEKRVEQLQKFQAELGHLNIDCRYHKWDNFGGWAAQISKHFKDWQEGKEAVSPLVEHQFNQLSELGFEFNVCAPAVRNRRTWQDNFDTFLEFQQVHGHSNVPHKYKADMRLGNWASLQRNEYKLQCEGKQHKLTQERYNKLENAGFLWDYERGRRNSKV